MFNCSTNHSLVPINWILNKTISASTLVSLGVTASGIGTRVSSLIIPGLVDPFNNTQVWCVAYGHGLGDFSPPPVILRIQGRLEPVNSLTAVLSNGSCCYHFYWTPPFTLPGVPILGYNINITTFYNGTVFQIDVTATTRWEYCPADLGFYIVSIAAVNSVGEGDIYSYTLCFMESKYAFIDLYNY